MVGNRVRVTLWWDTPQDGTIIEEDDDTGNVVIQLDCLINTMKHDDAIYIERVTLPKYSKRIKEIRQ